MTTALKIKQVADASGFTATTLRYYEEIGLLPASARTPAGYRTYDDGHARAARVHRPCEATGVQPRRDHRPHRRLGGRPLRAGAGPTASPRGGETGRGRGADHGADHLRRRPAACRCLAGRPPARRCVRCDVWLRRRARLRRLRHLRCLRHLRHLGVRVS